MVVRDCLHGIYIRMVAVVYSGPRYMWIPMDSSPVPWYSGIPTCVQWILMADLDITEYVVVHTYSTAW